MASLILAACNALLGGWQHHGILFCIAAYLGWRFRKLN
jgi:hypothetical protein